MDSNTRVSRVLAGTATSASENAATGNTEAATMAGQEQSTPHALNQALARQLSLPKYRRTGSKDAARLADAMLRCLNPPELNFDSLSRQDAKLLATFPAEIWAILFRHGREQSSSGITAVTLSAALSAELVESAGHTLVEGLGQLPGLTHLTLVNPPGGRIDLMGLHVLRESLSNIEIRSNSEQKWDVHVPQGLVVHANLATRAIDKSKVYYYDGRTQLGEPRTLAGIVYSHQAESVWNQQAIALNGVDEHSDVDEPDPDEGRIWCRHLAVMWLRARLENQSTDLPFDYGPFESKQSLRATRDKYPDLESDIDERIANGADALFAPANFGNLLADQFTGMEAGTTRQFLVNTPNHALALELKVKTAANGGPAEYVVTFYDPNHTATHERLVVPSLELLRKKGLADWIPASDMEDYFPAKEGRPVGALYSWQQGRANRPVSDTDFMKHVPAELKASPLSLCMAMLEGRSEVVDEILEIAKTTLQGDSLGRADFELCIAARNNEIPGLAAALASGRTAAVQKYVGWILGQSPQLLAPSQKVELLLSTVGADQPGLHLTASEKMEEEHAPEIAASIFGYIYAIASSVSLSLEDKIRLCAAEHEGVTAAQAALENDNPKIAADMVCAILKANIDSESQARLLACLGVEARDVLAAQTGTPDPVLTVWGNLAERDTQPK